MQKFEQVQYHVPPENQGQIVEVSYGCDGDYVYCKTFDQSDRTTSYARFEHPDTPEQEFDFDPWNGEPKLGDEVPFTKDEVDSDWESVASYVATFPSDDGEGACYVEVQIGEVGGHWFVRTKDDAGGSDECDGTSYPSRSKAESAAEDFAGEHNEAEAGEDAADYVKRQLQETAGEPDPEGEYCVYWDTVLEDSGPGDRYASPEAATAAAELANQGLHKHNPGGNLLCAYEPRRLVNGKWIGLDEEPEDEEPTCPSCGHPTDNSSGWGSCSNKSHG